VDGTPYALTVPFLFIESLQFTEDYYERSLVSSAVRLIRLLSMFISLLAPSVYVAVITYHQEMLPTSLLLSLAAQGEAVKEVSGNA
jgi:spore germination protein KA